MTRGTSSTPETDRLVSLAWLAVAAGLIVIFVRFYRESIKREELIDVQISYYMTREGESDG